MRSRVVMRALHSVLSVLLTPLIRQWLARRATRGKEDITRIGERFGHASIPRPNGTLIWVHAASVGEAQSVLALIRRVLEAQPEVSVLITTGTVTSAALVAQQNIPRLIHQFVPVDTYYAVRRFLAHWQPSLALWVESEFWPQLLWQTQARGTPMLLINARMSARSLAGWQRFPTLIRSLLSGFTHIYAGAPEDAARLRQLTAQPVADIGNLKYDADPLPEDAALLADLARATEQRRVWVAASTHAGEERILAEVQQHLQQDFPGLLLILIPRHATRGDAVAAEIAAYGGITLAQRSKGEPILPATNLYLADTMGELGTFYRRADLVFIGGSLVPVGGHNPLEPARLGAALISGTHVDNFASIMQHLEAAGALALVADGHALYTTLARLLRDDAERRAMAARASDVVVAASGASATILHEVNRLLSLGRAHENA